MAVARSSIQAASPHGPIQNRTWMIRPNRSRRLLMKGTEPRVVTLNHLGQLPMRANVGFAVRCAQRIRPCFERPPDAPRRREQIAAIDGAIRMAAAFCRGLPGAEPGRAAEAARRAAAVAEETCEFTSYAGYAAAHAAQAVANA